LIRVDGGTQMRAELHQEVYLDYRDKWLSGVEFDPVDLFYDGSTYWLADGFHRFYGAREAKRASIPAFVHTGTQRDAILHATGANASHGLRRSNADKRQAVETLLGDEEWVQWSDNRVAEQAAVSVQFVCNIRRELSTVDSSPAAQANGQPRTGRDGKKRRHPKRKPATQPREPGDESEPTGADPAKTTRPVKATADLSESYVDDLKNEVPESLFPVWRERETYFRLCDDLKTLAGQIRELGKTPAGKGCSAIAREVDEAGKALALCMPSVVSGKSWKSVGEAK
jgi:hypothetical protein